MSKSPYPDIKIGQKEPFGRPSKFTPEIRASIIDAISRCAPYQLAAEANGISESTLFEWLRIGYKHRDEGIQSDYANFSQSIKNAELKKVLSHTDNVSDHVDKWQADAWMLERRWHKHFSANAPIIELNERMAKIERESKNEKGSEETN